jgi:adenylate kinase
VIDIIKKRLEEKCLNGFILDGFPRNIKQAKHLDKILISINKKINGVFYLQVPEEVLIKRILGRFSCNCCGEIYNIYFRNPKINGVCDNCDSKKFDNRSDDNEEIIKNRLKVYSDSTSKLIDYYKKINLLITINGVESAPLIFKELLEVVNKLRK